MKTSESGTDDDLPRAPDADRSSEFERLGRSEQRVGLAAELWDFLRYNKKWWLLPILVLLLLLALLVSIGGVAGSPFVYPFF